jgi:ankyrin repeat protein
VLCVPSYKYRKYSKNYPVFIGLHWAARFGLYEAAKRYLRIEGRDAVHTINAQDSHGGQSLLYAAEHGHYEMTKLLLDKGAEVNAQGGQNGNALQAASAGGHEAIVKLLLDKGAEVNVQGGQNGNALQAASAGGHEAIVKLLLDKVADAGVEAQ